MNRSDFEKMTRRELRAYIIKNRTDEEAIQFLMETARTDGPSYPYPETEEQMKEQQAIIMNKIKQLEEEGKAS